MKFRPGLTILLLMALAILSPAASGEQPRYFEITFLSTNDLHARDVPFTLPGDPARNIAPAPDIGGMARIATVIKRTRAESSTPVVLVDSGDTTHGSTALPKAFHGESTIAAMNAMGYDAMVPGNHEFEWHSPDTVRNHNQSRFPWICANLVDARTGETWLPPYIIKEVGGARVAFLGLTIDSIRTDKRYVAAPELGLTIVNATETAARLIPELRQKADIVVVLSHLGASADTQLAQAVPGIDAIFGGHTHTKLSTPRMAKVGERTAFSLGAVPVVQASYHGQYVGKTRLVFRRDEVSGRYLLMSCKGELIPINNTIPDDPEIAGIIAEFQKRIPPPPPPKPAAQPAAAAPAAK